jgi:phosphatidyl-myo-inositol alpha-mannosyltransferase
MLPMSDPGHPRRVLMTADAVGGVWTYAVDLARGLAARGGVETVLAVLGPAPDAGQRAGAESVPGLTVLPTGLPLDWMAETPGEVEAAGEAVAAIAAAAAADFVHLNSPALAAAARFAVPVVGACHSCVATWWSALRPGAMPADFAWRTTLLARGYAAADVLVTPTEAFAQATARTYGLARRPAVVRNGRRKAAPPPPTARCAPQAAFVFTAGRLWDEGKNLAALDRAAARLPVPVVAAGPAEGPNGTAVALPHLRLLGRVAEDDVARHLAMGPIFASAARYEPFGLAVLEAAQAGCALVLADIPSLRELWDGAAEFAPPEDDAALAHAILRLLRERERRALLCAAAEERARRYSVEAMTDGMLEVYQQARRARSDSGAASRWGNAA